ncbi:F0F1 ATP synthase subunit delta [Salinisphaera sp. USBA-960]|uniref:F0F1 ATP synthase subunit delta n=1 Tax=Salinisphaera orenii TaxID=856731 RepID=UPI000DBE141F|nr:F0F1 ATP synthase subunit delta [Salifodinibacter halophilus]NNC27198.1 F0F1 ATP synthase subunit delta [Salifodinibacter halophilus]
MAETETVARPYAEAVFELAQADGALTAWADALAAIRAVVENPDGAAMIQDPLIDARQLADAVIGVAGDDLGVKAANLVRLLADKSRLEIAPSIAAAYNELYAAEQNTLDVDVTTANGLTEEQSSKLQSALETRLGKTIRLHVAEDENVLAGAVIKAGDLVFDHTVSGQLERLHQQMAR